MEDELDFVAYFPYFYSTGVQTTRRIVHFRKDVSCFAATLSLCALRHGISTEQSTEKEKAWVLGQTKDSSWEKDSGKTEKERKEIFVALKMVSAKDATER